MTQLGFGRDNLELGTAQFRLQHGDETPSLVSGDPDESRTETSPR
jgi:hypothetical protein